MMTFVRTLAIAGLGVSFAIAANAAALRPSFSLADTMNCGSCGKDKKDGEKKECPKDGDKKTSTMSNLGDCNKDKKECPKDKDKDKQTADNEKKDGECPSGGCGKKKQG